MKTRNELIAALTVDGVTDWAKYRETVRTYRAALDDLKNRVSTDRNENRTPAETIAAWVAAVGYDVAVVVLSSAIAVVGEWDARISGTVRAWAKENGYDRESALDMCLYTDAIHNCHKDQLAAALMEYKPTEPTEPEDAEQTTEPTDPEALAFSIAAADGTLTKTIYFHPAEIGRDLSRDDLRAADALGTGMLEQVLDDLIAFHGINPAQLPAVLAFIRSRFGLSAVDVCDCATLGAMDYERDLVRMTTDPTDPAPAETAENAASETNAEPAPAYIISTNPQFGSLEITFSEKPAASGDAESNQP